MNKNFFMIYISKDKMNKIPLQSYFKIRKVQSLYKFYWKLNTSINDQDNKNNWNSGLELDKLAWSFGVERRIMPYVNGKYRRTLTFVSLNVCVFFSLTMLIAYNSICFRTNFTPTNSSNKSSIVIRLAGLGVWFSLRVREVPGSNPGRALVTGIDFILGLPNTGSQCLSFDTIIQICVLPFLFVVVCAGNKISCLISGE